MYGVLISAAATSGMNEAHCIACQPMIHKLGYVHLSLDDMSINLDVIYIAE